MRGARLHGGGLEPGAAFFRFDAGKIWCLYWDLNDESF
jgi:hypothetical protein